MSEGYFDVTQTYYGTGPDLPMLTTSRELRADEDTILKKLRQQLLDHSKGNVEKQAYYEAKQLVKHLDIAVPRNLADIGVAVGWAGTTVDALDERVDFLGWATDDGKLNGLDLAFIDNNLAVESNYSHIDAFTTGVSFVSVGNDTDVIKGVTGTRQLISVESSSTATVIWDYRKRRSTAGLSQTTDSNGNVIMEALYLENVNVVLARDDPTAPLTVVSRDSTMSGAAL
jgi:hypothetical protein